MIDSFSGQYRFLSNFYPAEVTLDGEKYASVEHAYQAAKTLDPIIRKKFRESITAGSAKKLGKTFVLRPDWADVKISVMHVLLVEKFSFGTELAACLLATGDEPLIEGNWWGDRFWGVCRGEGENHLGQLLMNIRKNLAVEQT